MQLLKKIKSQKLLDGMNYIHILIILIVIFLIGLIGIFPVWFLRGNKEKENENAVISDASDIELMDYRETYGLEKYKKSISDSESDEPDEEMQIPEEVPSALTDEPIELADIHSASGLTAVFKCYKPGATQYTWETYDIYSRNWIEAPEGDVTFTKDELNRNVSAFKVAATQENDGLIIRCRVDFQSDPIEPIVEMAALYILKDDIKKISVSDYGADSGYINIKDIPINITYVDGSNEDIIGLNGMYFLDTLEESRNVSVDVYGNPEETLTVVQKYHEYAYLTPSEQEAIIRYKNSDTVIDAPVMLTGEDKETPVILKFDIEKHERSDDSESASATVTITATDNSTPYLELEYAFLPESEEPEEGDWKNRPSFEIDVSKGRQWIAYCRDKSGNIASLLGDINDVTTSSASTPEAGLEFSIRLEISDAWSQYNKIMVDTEKTDEEYEYRYMLTENEDSGWISQAEYTVHINGTYKVYVRDTSGNISETEIAVSNIDNNPPVIQFITEKENENEE